MSIVEGEARATTSTDPSSVFLTQPLAPRAWARLRTNQRNPTPWTRPLSTQAANDEWHFTTTCGVGASAVTTEGVAHGDFAQHYVVEALTTVAGSPRRVEADISWQGACPKTMKPGDIVLPGGAHARMADLGA